MSVLLTCSNCVYWRAEGGFAEGMCVCKAPTYSENSVNIVPCDGCCGEGKFKNQKPNDAGAYRLYDLTGNVVGFYHTEGMIRE